ncbi:MAG: hypothetical protein WCS31_03495 [Verrucomicrobiae bacterium]
MSTPLTCGRCGANYIGDINRDLFCRRCPDCKRLESFKDADNIDSENAGLSATNVTWDQLGAGIIWLSAFIGAYFIYKATDAFAYKALIFAAGTLVVAFVGSKLAAKIVGALIKVILIIALVAIVICIVAMLIKHFFV